MKYDCIVLDMDGTMIKSLDAKTKAFRRLFEDFGDEMMDRVESHHLDNPGMNRDQKIKYYYKTFLGQNLSHDIIRELSYKFSKYVLDEIYNCELMDGLVEFLDENRSSDIYVLSSAPQDEVLDIIEHHGLDPWFVDVIGHPKKKERVLRDLNTKYWDVVMIGDSNTDRDAAMNANIDFIAMINENNKHLKNYPWVRDFRDLLELED